MFSGALTAMVTPFREGKLDEARLREQVEFQIKGGIDGLVPVGTTGESPTLDFEEHERVIELTVQTLPRPRAGDRRHGRQRDQRSAGAAPVRQKGRRDGVLVGQSRITTSRRRKGCTGIS